MDFLHLDKKYATGRCFYYMCKDHNDQARVPTTFLEFNYPNFITDCEIEIEIEYDHDECWTIQLMKNDAYGRYYFGKGWKNVLKYLRLKKKVIIIFNLCSYASYSMRVFEMSGEELKIVDDEMIDATEVEVIDVDQIECISPVEPDLIHADNQFTFKETIDVPYRIKMPLQEFAGLIIGQAINVQFEENEPIASYVDFEWNRGWKRPVIQDWKLFLAAAGLEKGDLCQITWIKSDKLLKFERSE